ncbi:MAG: hypothetical protein ACK56F_11245 [bacterium]
MPSPESTVARSVVVATRDSVSLMVPVRSLARAHTCLMSTSYDACTTWLVSITPLTSYAPTSQFPWASSPPTR